MQISRSPWEEEAFPRNSRHNTKVAVAAKLNANPPESHVDKFFNKPCGYREAGFILTHACSNSLLEMKGRGNFQRSHVMARQTTTSKRVQQSQKQVPATTGTQCSNDIKRLWKWPLFSFRSSIPWALSQIFVWKGTDTSQGEKPAGTDMVYATANTSQENVLSRTEQNRTEMQCWSTLGVQIIIIKCFPIISKLKRWNKYSIIINRNPKNPSFTLCSLKGEISFPV